MKYKIKKKYIAMMLVLAMLLPNTVYAAGNENSEAKGAEALKNRIEAIKEEQEKFLSSDKMKKQNASNEKHRKIADKICDGEQYPSYYGGSYLNHEDELVVVLTDKSKEVSDKVKEAAGTDDVIIEYADASLEYLKQLQDYYSDKYEQLYKQKEIFSESERALLDNFRGSYVDEINNVLVIKIVELNEEKRELFQKIFGDNERLQFEDSSKFEETAAQWKMGRKFYFMGEDGVTIQSTGYRAYLIDDNGTRYNGFVTAGHGVDVGDYVYYGSSLLNSQLLGRCLASTFYGNVDGAFIAITTSTFEPTNTTCFSDGQGTTTGTLFTLLPTTIATNTDFVVNTNVYTVGATTYLKVGRITSKSEAITQVGIVLSDLLATNITVQDGDSGGCCFLVKNGGFAAAGTVSGKDVAYGYISKVANQISILGIGKY